MRLDKYLSSLELFTRKESRKWTKKGLFFVNDEEVNDAGIKIKEGDMIKRDDTEIEAKRNILILLNKPAGFVSSDIDEATYPSYRHLLGEYPYVPLLHIAGRLDTDTEGLLVLTSDGKLNHRIRSPKHKVGKVYHVETEKPVSTKDCKKLVKGVTLDDEYETRPAECKQIDDTTLELTLHEGKYHQVKRMLEAVGNRVTYLQRIKVGEWTLEGIEETGMWKEI